MNSISGSPSPSVRTPERRLRLTVGILTAVLGGALVAPTSASGAAGTPRAARSVEARGRVDVKLEFYGPASYVGMGQMDIADPAHNYSRSITTDNIPVGRSKKYDLHLAPGTKITVTFAYRIGRGWGFPSSMRTGEGWELADNITVPPEHVRRCYYFKGAVIGRPGLRPQVNFRSC